MNEVFEELYNNYLKETLDSIFVVDAEKIDYDEDERFLYRYKFPGFDIDIRHIWREDSSNKVYLTDVNNKRLSESYDVILPPEDNYFIIKDHGLYKIMDTDGNVLLKSWVNGIKYLNNNWFKITEGEKTKCYNIIKKINIEEYDEIYSYCDGLARVRKGDRYSYIDNNGLRVTDDWYSNASDFCNGYAVVHDEKGKDCLLDKDMKIISSISFMDDAISKGYIIANTISNTRIFSPKDYINDASFEKFIKSDDFYSWFEGNVIFSKRVDKTNGNKTVKYRATILGQNDYHNFKEPELYDEVSRYHNGFAIFKKDNKYAYFDTFGKMLGEKWFDDAKPFKGDYADVVIDDHFRSIDRNGEIHDAITYLPCGRYGYWILTDGTSCRLVRKDDYKPINNNIYEEIGQFNFGVAIAKKHGKYGIIGEHGEELSGFYYDFIDPIINPDHIIARSNDKWTIIDRTGKPISKYYSEIKASEMKNYIVKNDEGKYNILGSNYNELCDVWFDEIIENEGFFICVKDGKSTAVDKNGNRLIDYYDRVTPFKNVCVVGNKKGRRFIKNVVGYNNKLLFDKWTDKNITVVDSNESFTHFKIDNEDLYYYYGYDLGDYKVSKSFFKYKLSDGKDTIHLKYEPLKVYNSNLILCKSYNLLYMYVRDENKYILLGSIEDITINNNLIVKELYGAAAFLVNGKQLLNITNYYMHNLSGKKYHINDGIHILTKEEVYSENEDEIKARIEKSRKEAKEALEQKTREEALRKAMQEKEEQDRIIEENLKIKDATIQELLKNKARLEELEKKLGIVNKTRFKFSHLLIDVEGHKEINPDCFIIGLDRIDFQNMPVKNVKLSDLDLSMTNLTLGVNDFQYIYENDVSHSNLEGLYLLPNTNFDGVKMLGTSFSIDSDPKTMDINIDSFRKAIYDEDTTINGFHLVDLLDKEKRHKM